MNLNPKIPITVRIVAWLFLVEGWSAIAQMVFGLFHRNLSIPIEGILSIYAGLGLLRLSNGWRRFSLFVITLQILLTLIFFPIATGQSSKEQWTFLNYYPIWVSHSQRIAIFTTILVISLFQFISLVMPSVRKSFKFKPVTA